MADGGEGMAGGDGEGMADHVADEGMAGNGEGMAGNGEGMAGGDVEGMANTGPKAVVSTMKLTVCTGHAGLVH